MKHNWSGFGPIWQHSPTSGPWTISLRIFQRDLIQCLFRFVVTPVMPIIMSVQCFARAKTIPLTSRVHKLMTIIWLNAAKWVPCLTYYRTFRSRLFELWSQMSMALITWHDNAMLNSMVMDTHKSGNFTLSRAGVKYIRAKLSCDLTKLSSEYNLATDIIMVFLGIIG